jgi:microcompartment protein CcmL/EutN
LSDGGSAGMTSEALALIELSSIARGHRVADAMLKRAPVGLLRADWVSPGKFLVLVDGGVAAVDEAYRAGLDVAADRIVDKLFLPQAHASLWPALAGEARSGSVDSLGIVETTTVAATLLAGDAASAARGSSPSPELWPRSRPRSRRRSPSWRRLSCRRRRSSPPRMPISREKCGQKRPLLIAVESGPPSR